MNQENRELKREDYVEPACSCEAGAFADPDRVKMIPKDRIVSKMNELMSHRDYDGCERLLNYWMEEAKLGADLRGQLFLSNEMIGHYRKTGNRDAAFASIEKALGLIDVLAMGETITAGTTYVNAATACQAFQEPERAYDLFLSAERIYEGNASTQPELLGGLYNNMALTCAALGRFSDAQLRYEKALKVMEQVPGGKLEQAITYLNMADLIKAEKGLEEGEQEIFSVLDRAAALLEEPDAPKDGYYAFVCEKCAPVFSYYGYFRVGGRLKQAAEEIYEGSGTVTR